MLKVILIIVLLSVVVITSFPSFVFMSEVSIIIIWLFCVRLVRLLKLSFSLRIYLVAIANDLIIRIQVVVRGVQLGVGIQ